MMWNLAFISEEDFFLHVQETIQQYGEKLKPYVTGADVIDAKLMNDVDRDTLKRWVDGL